MKKIMKVLTVLLFSLFLLSSNSYAQHQKGSVFLAARMGHLEINGFGPRVYGGIELEFMIADNFGIHYSILFGKEYFHMPLAPVGGILTGLLVGSAFKSDSTRNGVGIGIIIGLLTALIPEGISYTIPVAKRFYIAPYVSPLQFEYLKSDNGQDAFAGGALGLRVHQYFNAGSFRLSPYFEYKIHYSENIHPGFSTGLNFALKLK
jgi:hypothetical protein